MANHRLCLLGPPVLDGPDGRLTLSPGSSEALLCFLAAQPMRLFKPPQLVAMFGTVDMAALARLRERLPVWPVREVGDSLGWDPGAGVEVDTSLFREYVGAADGNPSLDSLRAAAGLWRGPFLEGMHLAGTPEFSDWLLRKREHWKDWMVETLLRLVAREDSDDRAANWAAQGQVLCPGDERFTKRDRVRPARPLPVGEALDLQIIAQISGQPMDTLSTSASAREMGALLIRDALTGLYNRQYLQRRLSIELQREQSSVALVVMDLNGFKRVNDTFGHAAGDRMIVAVGEVILRHVGKVGVAARYGGDEFVAAMFGLDPGAVEDLVRALLDDLAATKVLFDNGQVVHGVAGSAGVALFGADGSDYGTLFEAADQAMYYAKRRMGGGVALSSSVPRHAAEPSRTAPPRGVVTFIACEAAGADALVSSYLERQGGLLFRRGNHPSRIYSAFASARDALNAARATQQAGLRVRLAVHTGYAEFTGSEYDGATVRTCGCLVQVSHSGQTILSQQAFEQVQGQLTNDEAVRTLGSHRLRDLDTQMEVFQFEYPGLATEFPPLLTLTTLPNNLLVPGSSFVGREHEVAEIGALLKRDRIVTLWGTGGAGKTRLSLQVASEAADEFPDGVWVVELAPLAEPGQVLQALANVCGLRDEPGRLTADVLADHLASKKALLVLDNCEHLLQCCADLVRTLSRGCSYLKLLTTSREPLGVPNETVWRVPSMSLPDPAAAEPSRDLSTYDGIRLFVERARLHKPGFVLTSENDSAVVEICERLDGIPLAIELAAARLKVLSVTEVLERLNQRFRLLTNGSRSAHPRQQTLRALIDWSHDLLSEPEQVLWRRLSVFQGGCSLAAVEAVCGFGSLDAGDILDLLSQLVDKSIITAEERDGETRYRLLETLREYGYERLLSAGEEEAVRISHSRWYLALPAQGRASWATPGQTLWLEKLDRDLDNIWVALRWCRQRGEIECELKAATNMAWFWSLRHSAAGREWVEELLEIPATRDYPVLLTAVLSYAGALASYQGDNHGALRRWRESYSLGLKYGPADRSAASLGNIGFAQLVAGDYDQAEATFREVLSVISPEGTAAVKLLIGRVSLCRGELDEAVRMLKEVLRTLPDGDRHRQAHAAASLGLVYWYQGQTERAVGELKLALQIYEEMGDQLAADLNLVVLGHIALDAGNAAEARHLFAESLARYCRLRTGLAVGEPECLEGVAALLAQVGRHEDAARLLGSVGALREAYGMARPPIAQPRHDALTAGLISKLGEAGLQSLLAEGGSWGLTRVATTALRLVSGIFE